MEKGFSIKWKVFLKNFFGGRGAYKYHGGGGEQKKKQNKTKQKKEGSQEGMGRSRERDNSE